MSANDHGHSSAHGMRLTLNVWRQAGPGLPGAFKTYHLHDVSPDMSFLEMLDVLNERLLQSGEEPVAFDHDCREGICGSCGFMIDGQAHGMDSQTTVCQLHMRRFSDGASLHLEPFRANAFPLVKDLVVDRSAFDRIIGAGGYISVNTGSAPDGNAQPIPKEAADLAMDAAACIGCGACVASCPNGAAMLFVGAKTSHLGLLPQGRSEQDSRVLAMVAQMDQEGFGNCSNHFECEAACPKGISVENIARLNRDWLMARLRDRGATASAQGTG